MTTAYTSLIGLALPVTGELNGTWGDTVNNYISSYVDAAVAGAQTISGTQTAVTLSVTNGSSLVQAGGAGTTGSAQYQIINCTGNPAGTLTITAPSSSKAYLILNATSTAQSVKIVASGPTTGVTIATGKAALVAWNGSDFTLVATNDASKISGVLAVANGGTGLSSGTSGGVPYFSGSTTMASSAALAANAIVLGGGAGAAPATTTTGTGVVTAIGNNTNAASGLAVLNASGYLAVAQGGTNSNATPTAGGVGYGTGTAHAYSSAGTSGQALLSGGAGAPTFGTLGTGAGGTGLTSFTSGGVVYASSTSALTTGSALTFDGTVLAISGGTIGSRLAVKGTGAFAGFDTGAATDGRVEYAYNGTNIFYSGIDSASLMTLMARSGVSLAFGANGSEQMRLTSTGLGIGTSSPSYKLDVQGSSGTTITGVYDTSSSGSSIATLRLRTAGTGPGYWDIRTGNTASGLTAGLNFFDNSAAASRMTIDSSGNLGLGVTPSAWALSGAQAVQVKNASLVGYLNNAYLSANVYFDSGGASRYIASAIATQYAQNSGSHNWYTAPSGTAGDPITFTQAMTLDASGNLLLGTTSATYGGQLTVRGAGSTVASFMNSNFVAATSGTQLNINAGATTGNTNFQLQVNSGGGLAYNDLCLQPSGGNLLVNQTSQVGSEKVGISFNRTSQWGLAIKNTSATSPNNATLVQFYYSSTNVGGINSTGTTTTYDSASDYRLKENVAPMTGALNKVAQLKPCTYTWKINGSNGQGFLAHELQEIVPDCVRGNKDDVNEDGSIKPQMIDTSFLVATLTAALQELKAEVDSLKAQLASK